MIYATPAPRPAELDDSVPGQPPDFGISVTERLDKDLFGVLPEQWRSDRRLPLHLGELERGTGRQVRPEPGVLDALPHRAVVRAARILADQLERP